MGKRVMACKSVDGHPLTMSGKVYEHGFGAHSESAVAFTSNGGKLAFDAVVGIDADAELLGAGKEGHGGQPSVRSKPQTVLVSRIRLVADRRPDHHE